MICHTHKISPYFRHKKYFHYLKSNYFGKKRALNVLRIVCLDANKNSLFILNYTKRLNDKQNNCLKLLILFKLKKHFKIYRIYHKT